MELYLKFVYGLVTFWSFNLSPSWTLNNGLARTPPMGWLTWERFRCNTDCIDDPENCISERLIKRMTDLMVTEGYADVGYEYVIIDDCWLSKERDKDGKLKPDPFRFPSGIRELADYVHSRGLKFGIYEDFGTRTCAGYPGSQGHLKDDADTFGEWQVDYVKFDGCNSDPKDFDKGYTDFGRYLNLTGRPMVYSCEWPLYQQEAGIKPNYSAITEVCNLWRNGGDIDDSWPSVQKTIDYYATNQNQLIPLAGPGRWNDPDQLVIGNFGLSYEQSVTQMVMWAIWASPLLMSTELRTIRSEYKELLQNRKIIQVNQDPLGIQGKRLYKDGGVEIWSRPLASSVASNFSYGIAILNRSHGGTPFKISLSGLMLGLVNENGYDVEELVTNKHFGIIHPNDTITVNVNPTGALLLRCTLVMKAATNDV